MGRRIEIEIDGALYTGATPSAKDQLEMLQIATKNSVLPALGDNASDMGLAVALASMDALSLNRLKELCIKNGKMVRDADSIPVAENLFQDAIQNYLLLLGKTLRGKHRPFLEAQRRERKRRGRNSDERDDSGIDWFLWRPCLGAGDACPPLARWADMLDGTYTIDDVQIMHAVIEAAIDSVERAREKRPA